MKGCIGLIIKTIIAVLVFYGLLHIGAIDYIKNKIDEYQNPEQEKMVELVKDIADLSGIGDEYSIERNFKILKNRIIIAEHNASGQKMLIVEPNDNDVLTQEDIKNKNLKTKLQETLKKKQYKIIKLQNIEVIKTGNFKSLNQTIPYARITANVQNLPIKSIDGIVGVAKLENKNLILISVNEKGKYSQIITDSFYSKVKQ